MPPAEDAPTPPASSMAAAPSNHNGRAPMPPRLQSPIFNRFPLGSNDDDLERAQARAARAASIRRKSAAVASAFAFAVPPPCPELLDHEQVMDLLHNCLKLASENKINQKNTWELNLIDHLSEIIQAKAEVDDSETNFQKASCTLEAGVKIYSLRVDSLHSEAYKVLGGINRVGREEVNGNAVERSSVDEGVEQEASISRKNLEKKTSPLSTLETSFEALNIKKFDVAFTVDPLYHQTSAQFDEGGAKGLLLNNLGVYGSCRVLFDSSEVPENCMLHDTQNDKSEVIDLSFAKEYIDQMMLNMPKKAYISPTLREIMDRFGENSRRLQNVLSDEEHQIGHGETEDIDHPNLEDNMFGGFVPGTPDDDDPVSVVDDNSGIADPYFGSHPEEIGDYSFQELDTNIRLEKITDFLSLGLGFAAKSNAWAGPDYWKYKRSKGSEQVFDSVEQQELPTKKTKVKKPTSDIDFTKSLEKEFPDFFAPPKNPKSLLLPANRAPCSIRLPEDCHYKPESLAKFFLLPDVMCFAKKSRVSHDDPREPNGEFVSCASWDQESVDNDHYDDGNFSGDMDDPGSLVRLPRQVNKVDVQYEKVSKQVDVHALKETLWTHIHETVEMFDAQGREFSVSLRQIMRRLHNISITDSQKHISPHLSFICLLHLANEHSLTLRHHPTFDDVDIIVPESAFVK